MSEMDKFTQSRFDEIEKILRDSTEADRKFRPWLILAGVVCAALIAAHYLGFI